MKKIHIAFALALLLTSCATNEQETIPVPEAAREPVQQEAYRGAETAQKAVHGFYTALSTGNGSAAVQFLIPEKRETGNYTSNGMSNYYGNLEQMLNLERVEQAGVNKWRVVYTYKETGKAKCKDIMDVNVAEAHSGWFIESIAPQQVCQTEAPPAPAAVPTPSNQEPSIIDNQIKCVQNGQANYQDIQLDDGSIEFEFFYSPELGTCILERKEYGPGTIFTVKLYDMFSNAMLVHYSTNGTDFCDTAVAIGVAPNAQCTTSMNEFNLWKNAILGK